MQLDGDRGSVTKRSSRGQARTSDGEDQKSLQHSDVENDEKASKRQRTELFFRCPMYSTDPQKHSCTKCKHWRNQSIAAVTRHALNDAGHGSEKWTKIKNLSSLKLNPEQRWRRYFIIFNNGVEDDQMNHPYQVNTDREDQVTDLLRSAMDRWSSNRDSIQALRMIQRYHEMLTVKRERDDAIRLQCQEEMAAARRKEVEALRESHSILTRQFEHFMETIRPETQPPSMYNTVDTEPPGSEMAQPPIGRPHRHLLGNVSQLGGFLSENYRNPIDFPDDEKKPSLDTI